MARRRLNAACLPLVVTLLAACDLGGRGGPPPSPTETMRPETIALVATAEHKNGFVTGLVHLEDGSAIDLGDTTARLPNGYGQLQPGDLILAAAGPRPAWWVDLDGKIRVRASSDNGVGKVDGACWWIRGGGYDVGDAIHFSSGLFLTKAPTFKVEMDWIKDPLPARPSDYFCVDRTGTVTSLDFIWQPY
jgi:hypothetical protein